MADRTDFPRVWFIDVQDNGTAFTEVSCLNFTNALLSYDGPTNTLTISVRDALHAIAVASAAINTTETVIAGGLNNARILANTLRVGTTFRITLTGTCTSSAANASAWRVRFGTAGTVADGVLGAAANSVAGTTGTDIPFEAVLTFTVRTIGATGTIAGHLRLTTGVTGISADAVQVVPLTPTAINTTVNNWLSVTYEAAAVTTTATFQTAVIEVVKV